MIHDSIRAIRWQDDALLLLDQRKLPAQQQTLRCTQVQQVVDAIRDMVVRGAPAIGITAAFGVVLALRQRLLESPDDWQQGVETDMQRLAAARPTAVNLFWALERMRVCLQQSSSSPLEAALAEAQAIHQEDIAANHHMGQLGAALIEPGSGVLTHCNTGSLATGGFGTALGVIRRAWADQRIQSVYADETRPWLQGARLTAWELVQDNIPMQLVVEGAAASLMKQGKVQWVIVGSDRISANGDVANKIGTYSLAVNARHHAVGFMVVAPSSTVDMKLESGDAIPIETRDANELLQCGAETVAAQGAGAWNPVFDVTPAELVDVIITERGVVRNPTKEKMRQMMQPG